MSPQRPSAELTLGPLHNISPTTFIVCLGNTQREVLKADHPVGYSDFHFHHMSGFLSTPAGVCLPVPIPDPFPFRFHKKDVESFHGMGTVELMGSNECNFSNVH